jgi:hypothetical protein
MFSKTTAVRQSADFSGGAAASGARGDNFVSRLEGWFPADRPVIATLRVFAAALAVRLLYPLAHAIFRAQHIPANTFAFAEIGNIALNIFHGRGFSSPFSQGNVPTAWECPLIPYLWAAVMRLQGEASERTYRALVLLQTIPTALSVSLYWLVARYVTRRSPALPSYTPVAAALVFCFWPESLLRIPEIWYYPWQELAIAALVCAALWWCDDPNRRSGAALGAAAGILALINVTPLPVYAVALMEPFISRRAPRRAMLGAALLSAAVAGSIVAPWLIRNAVELHAFVPVRSNGWYELFQGNNPHGCIREQATSLHPALDAHEAALYKSLGEIGYVRFCRGRALGYMRAHPARTAWRAAERFYVVWCTDIFDRWPWDAQERLERTAFTWIRNITITCSAVVPLVIVIYGLFSGRLRELPHPLLFLSVFLFMPLPHYFTLADHEYLQTMRIWLAFLAIIVLLRRSDWPGNRFKGREIS